tara:strand:- start:894 stop:1193 length:300 start_codon:yes stop_codon:yes gene_type:complete
MSKGFWLVTTTVTNPAFAENVEAFQSWIESVGGSVFAKDLVAKTVEGVGGKLSVIIDSPSKQAAIDAYNSPEYNELSKLRWANSTDTNITIIDGSVSDQ